jgi:putative transposase
VRDWSAKTELPAGKLIGWIGVGRSKFYDWRRRRGPANEHNDAVLRDTWLTDDEIDAVVQFHRTNPGEGYRRLAWMMVDADASAVSPSSVYRILKKRGLLQRWNRSPSKKGDGFDQPTAPARTLAYRRNLRQHLRHVFLPVQPARRLQPLHRALGTARANDRAPLTSAYRL